MSEKSNECTDRAVQKERLLYSLNLLILVHTFDAPIDQVTKHCAARLSRSIHEQQQ